MKITKKIFFIFVIIFIFSVIFLNTLFKNNKIVISNQITNEIYLKTKIREKDILVFEWEHSFEHVLWTGYYRIDKNKKFNLFEISVEGFGAGIPAEMDCEYEFKDGKIYMKNIKGSSFSEFNWINSKKQLKKIKINDKIIIEGKDLPERQKIKLSIK